jgi:MFS family permease
MGKRIIAEALQLVMEDIKLVRIAFITSFCHSLIIIFLLIFNINNMFVARFETWVPLSDVMEFLVTSWIRGNVVTSLIIVIIILMLWYAILYPIGQAAIIHYLRDQKFSIRDALAKWLTTFFPMFEFSALSGTFSMSTFIFIIIRLFMLDIVDNIFVRIIFGIRWLSILVVTILWPYSRYIIVIEKISMYDAIKRSGFYAIRNLWQTTKFVFLELLLLLRFLINIVFVIWVPFLLLYIASWFNLINSTTVWTIVAIVSIVLLLCTAYINGIIEAFFATYWYKIYNKIVQELDWDE